VSEGAILNPLSLLLLPGQPLEFWGAKSGNDR